MSPRPVHREKMVTPSGTEAEVLSGGGDARITFHGPGQCTVEPLVPGTSRDDTWSSLDGEPVCPSTKSEKGKTQKDHKQEPSASDVAILPPMAPGEVGSQAMRRGSAIRSSSVAARRARRAAPYDVEDLRLRLTDTSIGTSTISPPSTMTHLRSSGTSSPESAQVGQEPRTVTLSPQSRSTDDKSVKASSDTTPHLTPQATEQKKTNLEEALRRRWGDDYPRAVQVFSSEGKLLDMLRYRRTRETKQESPDPTPKFELSFSGQPAFAADPFETHVTPNSPNNPAADQAHGTKGGDQRETYEGTLPQSMSLSMSLTPDRPLARYRYGNPPPQAAGHTQARPSDTEAATFRACPDSSRIGRLVVHEPVGSNAFFRRPLRTRPVTFGSFPEPNAYGRTEAEETNPTMDEEDLSRDTSTRAEGSFDGKIERIIGKIEMLEIMIAFLGKQMDTMGLSLKELERKCGQ